MSLFFHLCKSNNIIVHMLLINQIKLHLDEDESSLKKHLLKKLRISESELITYRIYSRSIDARK